MNRFILVFAAFLAGFVALTALAVPALSMTDDNQQQIDQTVFY